MKIVICDDEKIYVDKVYDIVKKYCENDEISYYENAEQLLNDIENSTYNNDIYILDIEIDNVNGLDIAKAIREKDTSALIIFLTNYDKYVYDAFEVKTFRYIPKDVIEEKLPQAVKDAVVRIKERNSKNIYVGVSGRVIRRIELDEIVFIEKYQKNIIFNLLDKSVILGNPDYVFHVIQLSNFNRIIFALGMKLINITIYLIARRKIRNINYKILGNPAYIVFVIVGFIVSLKMMSVVIDNSVSSLKLGVSILFVVFIFMFGILIFLTDNLYNEKLKTKENEYMAIKSEMLEKSLKDINRLYDENSKNFHEFKHHINIINSLLLDSSNKKAIEYLKGIDLYSRYSQVFHTGNDIIDTVLNVKNTEANQKHISLFADINIDKVTVNDADLCSVLSNLIDNAIEAVDKTEKNKNIKLTINQKGNMLFIAAENPSSSNPLENNFNSQKKGNHGWGMKIINDIVNKYNGNITTNYDNEIFKIKIMLIQEKTV